MATPEAIAAAQKLAMGQFLSTFIPFAEAQGGADYAEMSAILSTMGVTLTPEQLEGAGKQPAPGAPRKVPVGVYQPPTEDEISPAPPKGESFTLHPGKGLPIRYAKTGIASQRLENLYQQLVIAADKLGDADAIVVEEPNVPADKAGTGALIRYSWKQYLAEARRFAKALLSFGFEPFQAVAICGFNHPVWFFAHVGAIAAGGMSAGTYTTNSPDLCQFVASDSNSRVVVVDTVANLKKYLAVKDRLPNVKHAVIWGVEELPTDVKEAGGDWVLTYPQFLKHGDSIDDAALDERTKAIDVKNCQALIYTSGTTGTPKGVMMSHDSIAFAAAAAAQWLMLDRKVPQTILSFLPLSHIAAQALDIGIPFYLASQGTPYTVHCARPDALKGTLGASLKSARPTAFFGVPRVWEKFVEGIKAKSAAEPAPKTVKQLKAFAARVGVQGSYGRQTGASGELPLGYEIAQKAVHAKVREALGLDRCTVCMTGAAPITRETLDFMAAVGVDILEVYGMSETAGMGTTSRPTLFKFGSCGPRTFPMELKTEHVEGRDKAGEGEICFRGRHVMMGYLGAEAKTRETIDEEGWLHSGDIGRIDADGQVYITGRIKELIITAGGENVAPVPVESRLKAICPAISNAVMIGDKRKYNTVLITLKTRPDIDTGDFFDELIAEATAVNPNVKTVKDASHDEAWRNYLQAGIDKVNAEAASNASKIQKFAILSKDLSLPGGELTGTLKLKRDVVAEKYKTIIDGLYNE
jgi:long-chain-fatty-acid--CoA ligase ACSBG